MSDTLSMPPTYGSHGLNLTDMQIAPPVRGPLRMPAPYMGPQTVSQLLAPRRMSAARNSGRTLCAQKLPQGRRS